MGNKDQATNMDGKWVKTKMKKMIYGAIAPRVEHPTLAEKKNVRSYFKNDMVHMMLELEYVLPLLPNLETYYLLHRFQICLKVGVALPILKGHITKKQFLAMWVIKDLEWREFLVYSITCCYIQYHQPRNGVLEFMMGYLGFYALKYYCRLKYAYWEYYH